MKLGYQARRAYDQIRKWIIEGKLLPGEKLKTQALANEMGNMSRMPIRDALRVLVYERLVVGGDGRNWSVALFSRERIQGAGILREILEGGSARLCAQEATAEDVARLRRMASRCDDEIPEASDVETVELEKSFHTAVAEVTGCQELIEEIVRWNSVFVPGLAAHICGERSLHSEIVDAIATGDGDLAEKVMREHVRAGMLGYSRGVSMGVATKGA